MKQKIKKFSSIKQILLFIFFAVAIIIIYPSVILIWNELKTSNNSYADAPPFFSSSMLMKIFIVLLIIILSKKTVKKNLLSSNPLKKFDEESQNKIMNMIKEFDEKSFVEAREKYPFAGKSIIGKEFRLLKDMIIKLDSDPLFKSNSCKIRALKVPKGEIIKILGLESNHYIIQTSTVDKGYCEDDNMFEDLLYDQLDKQNEYKEKILKRYLNKIGKKYNLSEKEISEVLYKYYGEGLLKRNNF